VNVELSEHQDLFRTTSSTALALVCYVRLGLVNDHDESAVAHLDQVRAVVAQLAELEIPLGDDPAAWLEFSAAFGEWLGAFGMTWPVCP